MNATRLAVLVGLFACGERSSLEPGSRPDHLAFSVQPGTSAVGSPIIPAVQVSVLDASGNLLTGFSGQVTVALYSQECGDSLSGTTTVNAVAGVAAFADLRLHRVCYDILQATTPALLPAFTSVPFLVHPAGITQIAFARDSNVIDVYAHADVYVMNLDGTGLTNLTHTIGLDAQPTWSPDGARIAFQSDRGGDADIYVMNADGSNLRNLTNAPGADYAPAWSPDGLKIAFVSERVYPGTVIYVINVDGTGLTKLAGDTVKYFTPTWSPDSRKIAFVDGRDAFKLYVMNADGSGVTRVGAGIIAYSGPAWSPDGTKLLFNSPDQSGGAALYTVNVDGTGLQRLVNANVVDPSWSPDGTAIAFAAPYGDGHYHIFIANADGIGNVWVPLAGINGSVADDVQPQFRPH